MDTMDTSANPDTETSEDLPVEEELAEPTSPEADSDEAVESDAESAAEAPAPSAGSFSLFSHVEQVAPTRRERVRAPEQTVKEQSAPGGFGLVFQAPDLSEVAVAPRRRRRAADPVPDVDEGSTDGEDRQEEQPAQTAADSDEAQPQRQPRARRSTRGGRVSRDDQAGQDAEQARGDDAASAGDTDVAAGSGGDTDDDRGGDADGGSRHDSDNDTDIDNDGDAGGDNDGDSDGEGDSAARRRRRRGGKGRRGRGTGGDDESTAGDGEPGADAGTRGGGRSAGGGAAVTRRDPVADSADSGADDEGVGSKRRRRRTRSGETSERVARDEVSGVKGSTRLEAKRLRRREGREAGRRRTIITEAEFLARRESVERVMVVRGLEDRTQIGVLEDGVLVEHYVSRETSTTMVGNVYLGRVQNVLPSMEAAFVDIGKGRNAVLYAGEVNWDAAGLDNEPKRIENALKSGESVLVQVTKDPIGHKGSRLTSQISLPGRYLVYVPGNSMTGISRKLPDTERTRLKKILKEVVPEGAGVIVRTAAEGASEAELRADVERLTSTWERIQATQKSASAPALLHGEPDMTVRVIRDVFNEDFSQLIVSGDAAWREVSDYIGSVAPDLADRLVQWSGTDEVFTHFRVTESLAKAMDRKVWLPSGGSLVIDRTEAMTVVDVNTGKYVGSGGDLEETVTRNNIEAAEEIVRQLRLRDIGGIIVIDFIDMVLESNRDLVVRRLLECLGRDRTKHQVAEVTSLGLVQMTRKRVGSGLIEVFSEQCSHCGGRGILVHPEPVEKSSNAPEDNTNGGANRSSSGAARSRDGRRSRSGSGSGGDGSTATATRNVLPPPNAHGPTPAQIAAAAHAAAIAASNGEGHHASPAAVVEAPAEAPATADSTATATALAPAMEAHASTVDPVVDLHVAPATEPAPALDEDPTSEPAPARSRRRRGRVVAPAGPPTGG